jgi:hypothetical protein
MKTEIGNRESGIVEAKALPLSAFPIPDFRFPIPGFFA